MRASTLNATGLRDVDLAALPYEMTLPIGCRLVGGSVVELVSVNKQTLQMYISQDSNIARLHCVRLRKDTRLEDDTTSKRVVKQVAHKR